jgi:parallel beta-helix repeat protein
MRTIFTAFVFLTSCVLSCKTVYFSTDNFNVKDLSEGDSVLFKRGERYFTHIDLFKGTPNDLYFGAYGDTSLAKPVLDGSIYHFDFDAGDWHDHEIINGHKFYKKAVKGLESVENVYAGSGRLIMAREPDIDEEVVTGQKNSFAGFFKIDSVDVKSPKKVFYDFENKKDWSGAEIVTKTQQWSYEVRSVISSQGRFEVDENTVDAFRKSNGYFIQRHKNALDSENEWYYDEKIGTLYFSAEKEECVIHVSSNRNDNNSGFDIRDKKNVRIEDLEFRNYKSGIKIENSERISISNCVFTNCTYGILTREKYNQSVTVSGCSFKILHSYGIRLLANNSVIEKNHIDSIGLTLGSESRGFNNLDGIELYGKNNIISKNTVKNTGYCGIRFFNCSGSKVIDNHIENTMQVMSDGGGIYTYHSSEGNKLIRGNKVINAYGNAAGTQGKSNGASGIYLDELSLHFRVDSNYVKNCGVGIYIQNSTKDTLYNNTTEKSREYELHINNAGSILNGGNLNPENDPGFNPDSLSFLPEDYVYIKESGIIRYKKKHKIVFVEPGGHYINDNSFDTDPKKYTFCFRTWRHINDELIEHITGTDDFFRENIHDKRLSEASVFIVGGNVKNTSGDGKTFDHIKNTFDKSKLDYLKRIFIYVGRGAKYPVEK